MRQTARLQRGFTLIEAIVVIVVMGIVVALSAMFVRQPIEAYFDVSRRAELTDIADTALRRMARDLHSALPNSIRQSGNYLEFVPVTAAGRYRAEVEAGGGGDPLDFTSDTDSSFDVLGPAVAASASDSIVVYNLGIPGSDVYAGTSRRAAVSGGSTVTYTVGGTQFPFASPGNRFQVVGGAVSYECAGGFLRRYAGYAIQAAQPTPPGSAPAILASNVSACAMSYTPGASERSGLVAISLTLSKDGESVTLYHEVHVNNAP
jgi:MSHA biogenesis protein MshO